MLRQSSASPESTPEQPDDAHAPTEGELSMKKLAWLGVVLLTKNCAWLAPWLWWSATYILYGCSTVLVFISSWCLARWSWCRFGCHPRMVDVGAEQIDLARYPGHVLGRNICDSDLEIQSGILRSKPYSVIYAPTTAPQYVGQVRTLVNPRPGMSALQLYMQWREAHAKACNLPMSRR